MTSVKRPAKPILNIVKAPAGVVFSETVVDSMYVRKLTEAIAANAVIQILKEDKYYRTQLKMAAKKIHAKLLFGEQGDNLYVKAVVLEGEKQRLMLYLREPRTMADLQSRKYELHLPNTLAELANEKFAHEKNGKWVLTERGFDAAK